MSAKNFMSYGDAETVFSSFANAIKDNKVAVAAATSAISAMKDGSELDSFGDVEVALLDKADTSDLGTAAAKDSTNAVTSGSTDLVESGAVKDAIDAAVAAAYHHAGTKTVAQLTHDLLIAANEGNVYNITDSGTTTSDFIEGIGKQIDAGDNVGICKVGNVYMFDLLSGLEDTSIFVQKSQTAGLLKNDGTVNATIESTVAGKQNSTDNNLQTTDKTVVGGINELKSGLTNKDKIFLFDMTDKPATLTFTGSCMSRMPIAEIIAVGQAGITPPMMISASGDGQIVNASNSNMQVSANETGVAGTTNGRITIGNGIGANWGRYMVRGIANYLDQINITISYDS